MKCVRHYSIGDFRLTRVDESQKKRKCTRCNNTIYIGDPYYQRSFFIYGYFKYKKDYCTSCYNEIFKNEVQLTRSKKYV